MPNIADVMLDKRIGLLEEYERALAHGDWYPPHRRALVERRDHLRVLCLRGLTRCYPAMSEAEREAMLERALLFRERPRTDSLGGGYILVGSR